MSKLRLLFEQTLMISTGVLFLVGLEGVVCHLLGGEFNLYWYQPISIFLAGFFGAFPTLLLNEENLSGRKFGFRVILHCLLEFGIVSLMGLVFHWYTNKGEYLIIVLFYFLIYGFVWLASIWMHKTDEKKINRALSEIQDEE